MKEIYGYWGEHPKHPIDDWKDEVANSDTRLGYWEWIARFEELKPGKVTVKIDLSLNTPLLQELMREVAEAKAQLDQAQNDLEALIAQH